MLNNKVVLVNGASAGIGRAVAIVCAREGAKIVVSDINKKDGEETAALVRAKGSTAIFVAADVVLPEHAKALGKRVFNRYPLALSAAKGLTAASVRQTLRCAQGERE